MNLSPIDHVFVLMLENRSFDQMLGYAGISGTDAASGNATQVDGLPPDGCVNYDTKGSPHKTARPAPFAMPEDPPHEYDAVRLQLLGSDDSIVNYSNTKITNSGFVKSYESVAGNHPLDDVMACYDPGQLPVLTALAREFCVCDRWFASLPGPTIPNRLFLHAATSGGDPKSPSVFSLVRAVSDGDSSFQFVNGNVFQRMTAKGIPWTIYHGDEFAMAYALEGVRFGAGKLFTPAGFASDLDRPNLPNYVFIEPDYGNLLLETYRGGNSQHPIDDVTSGEKLLKNVYEAIRASACWPRSVLIVTYDEHGGFYDHVTPPGGIPAPGDVPPIYDFNFTQLGVRVPAVIISPWIPRNLVDHTIYDHTSILATLRARFPDLGFFTQRDRLANDLSHLFLLAQPRTDAPMTLPAAAVSDVAPSAAPSIKGAPDAAFLTYPGASQRVESTQVGFLHVALKHHLQLAARKEKPAIVRRVSRIQTKGEAKLYLRDVKALMDAKKITRRRATKRSKSVRTGTLARHKKTKRSR